MNHLSEFKTQLGDRVETMSEQDIQSYYQTLDQMTDIFFDMWCEELKNNKDLT